MQKIILFLINIFHKIKNCLYRRFNYADKQTFCFRILLIFVLSGFLFFLSSDYALSATAKNQFDAGLENTAEQTGHLTKTLNNNLKNSPEKAIGLIVKNFLSFLGIIFLGLIMYGGYIWMLARGNQQKIDKAKSIIINSIVGLIIILAAYAITSFVASDVVF